MATRIDLPDSVMQQALELLRIPQSIQATARQMRISETLLRTNLERHGLMEEFKGRKRTRTPIVPINLKAWDEAKCNKYLIMKLRHYA